ncbi:hypothetical protein QYH69_06895 [Paraburkholderia sp. SARCC-3016]|uniref:hypothetical protein n=1 Tax=Paraburkholderia sp. SARCC-3016 TaxID=3058611 RepID=UPI0028068236|nr:hypothetical protein [Paraburkholderia sp. SARCC-3016]MDQ7976971.1 hypothetical protein [Paraburkholderia sp. SARCC-3016]
MFLLSNPEDRRGLTVLRAALGAVLVWSLIETPFELAACVSGAQSAALVFSKALLVILITCACTRASIAPFARLIALFVCGASVLAIVPALPSEFRYDRIGFALSSVECALKALAIAVLVSHDAGVRLWNDWQRSS